MAGKVPARDRWLRRENRGGLAVNTMNFEHETFDFHGVFIFPDAAACPQGTRAGMTRSFGRSCSVAKEKRSKEQNLKELGF